MKVLLLRGISSDLTSWTKDSGSVFACESRTSSRHSMPRRTTNSTVKRTRQVRTAIYHIFLPLSYLFCYLGGSGLIAAAQLNEGAKIIMAVPRGILPEVEGVTLAVQLTDAIA